MEKAEKSKITIEAIVVAPIEKVWTYWSEPDHVKQWAFASDDWHAPHSENDLRTGGKFSTTMAAKDGSYSFDFGGTYTKVEKYKLIEYTMSDDRKVKIGFDANGSETKITQTFEAESENPIDMQRSGWQAILDNFKKYIEIN